jgi:hypothetical protein
MIVIVTGIISFNSTNNMMFIMGRRCVFFEVRAEFLNDI